MQLIYLDRHSLALVHVQIPIERKVEQPQLCESLLPQCFRLRHRWHARIYVHDRSGARQATLAPRRVPTGSGMTSARDDRTRKTWFIVWKCASSVPTHPSLFARLFLLRRPTCGCTWTCCLDTGTFSIASEFCTFKKRFTFSIATTIRQISYFFTQDFSHSPGRNWRKWITKIGKQFSLKLNEQQSENFSSSSLMDSSGKLYVWRQFWRFIKFFSAFLEITKSHSQSFLLFIGKNHFPEKIFCSILISALTHARDTPAREKLPSVSCLHHENFFPMRKWKRFTANFINENLNLPQHCFVPLSASG